MTGAENALGGLALSAMDHGNAMLCVRAAHWRNTLRKVGLPLPYWAVHDIGLLALLEPSDQPPQARPALDGLLNAEDTAIHHQYVALLDELGASEVLHEARSWRLSDELLSVLIVRVMGPLFERFREKAADDGAMPLDPTAYERIPLANWFSEHDRRFDLAFLQHLMANRLRLLTAVEQIDLDTLRLLGMFGAEAAGAMEMVDLLGVLDSPEANDVVNFSLDLLPSVLETKRASGQQSFAVDGYSGVERRGTIDSLVLSELAFDDDVFERRFAEKEVFYYAREKQHEEDRRLHYIMVDASASMRGQRSVFARGLALTLIKKLQLQGEDVYFRFFDSRLYEVQSSRGRSSKSGISVPHVLCFRGERGRNYSKVFRLLVSDLKRLAQRQRRSPILYLLTHAECHVPVDIMERLAQQARLYGVFMLPSVGELELEYLPLLDTIQVVDHASLTQTDARVERALAIVHDVADRPEAAE